jgi:sec-independent protein translocase protein TatA
MKEVPMLFAFFGVGTIEMVIIGAVSVMLFGGRLPKVARSIGQSIVEFKRGFLEVEAECAEINKAIESKEARA